MARDTLPGVTVTATREAAAMLTIPLAVTTVGVPELREPIATAAG